MRKISLTVCISLFFIFVGNVFADPVRITSGTATVVAIGSPTTAGSISTGVTFNLTGNGVVFQASREGGLSQSFAFPPIGTIVQPGAVLPSSINILQFGLGGSGGLASGTLAWNGTVYGNVFYFPGPLNFTYMSPVVVPNFSGTTFSMTIPFTMSGSLQGGCQSTLSNPCQNIAGVNFPVYGNGDATLNFRRDANGNIIYSSSQFVFSTAEPTPEPATLLLFGSGIAGLAGYAAKRRKKKQETNNI